MTIGDQPMLDGLREVSDDELYQRLLIHQRNKPTKEPVLTYGYRLDLWEMVNKAIRAEIIRRRAVPPPWWTTAPARPAVPESKLRPVAAVTVYLILLAVVAVLAVVLGR